MSLPPPMVRARDSIRRSGDAYGGIGGSGPYSQSAWGAQNILTARADFDIGGFKNQFIAGFDASYQSNARTFFAYTLPPAAATPSRPWFLLHPRQPLSVAHQYRCKLARSDPHAARGLHGVPADAGRHRPHLAGTTPRPPPIYMPVATRPITRCSASNASGSTMNGR